MVILQRKCKKGCIAIPQKEENIKAESSEGNQKEFGKEKEMDGRMHGSH